MPDQFTETNVISYGNRVSSSFGGIVLGFFLFIAAFPLLWWNEGRSLHRLQTLDEGRNAVVMVSADQVNPGNDGKLIYVTGNATTDEVLNDNWFGVSVNALKLNRIAEMYQWEESKNTETHKNSDGSETQTTTYSYNKAWRQGLIDSSKFKHPEGHENPASMPYNSQLFTAQNIKLGAFALTNNFISQIFWSVSYPLTEQNAAAMNDQLKSYFKLNNGEFVYGDSANPQLGAMRIHYMVLQPAEVSVIGKQENERISPYYTRNGNIQLLQRGTVPADAMFASAENSNSLITWLIRAGGFFLMWMGLGMMVSPISLLAEFVPVIGGIVNAGLGLIASIIALICSMATIGIAWMAYRPLIGGSLLVAAFLFFFGGIGLIVKGVKALKTKVVHPQPSAVAVQAPIVSAAPASALASSAPAQTFSIPAGMPEPPKNN